MSKSRVFEIEICNPKPDGSYNYSALYLPATTWEQRDALDRAGVIGKSTAYRLCCNPLRSDISYLPSDFEQPVSLYELNHLAKQIDAMGQIEHGELTAFEALVETDKRNKVPLTASRLINLAASINHVLVAPVGNDKELGEFVIENGLDERLDTVSDAALPLLDIEKIGRECRESEGGIFLHGLYAIPNGEIKNVPCPAPDEKPGCTIELTVSKGFYHDADDEKQTATLLLPATTDALEKARAAVEAAPGDACSFTVVDCIVPRLTELMNDALEADDASYSMVHDMAQQLRWLDEREMLTTYKAMLSAAPKDISLSEALDLSYQTEGVCLQTEASYPVDYAKEQLRKCGVPLVDKLCETVNLYKYGKMLMEENQVLNTPYGMLRATDGPTMEQRLNRNSPAMQMQMG